MAFGCASLIATCKLRKTKQHGNCKLFPRQEGRKGELSAKDEDSSWQEQVRAHRHGHQADGRAVGWEEHHQSQECRKTE